MSAMAVYDYNSEDPITQEVETITPEVADRISARIALQDPTPGQLVWVGLEQKAKETRRWRTDVRGARKAARAQKRADDLHRTYLAVRKQTASVEELAELWNDYEQQVDKADDLYERHETITRKRTTELRLKAVGSLVIAAGVTQLVVPLRFAIIGWGTVGLATAGTLWFRSLYTLGTAQHRKHERKQRRSTAPTVTSHLQLMRELPPEDVEPEPFVDRYQILRDVLAVQRDGEERAFCDDVLQRLQDRFGDQYSDLDVRQFGRNLKTAGYKPKKMRIGEDTKVGVNFDDGVRPALTRAEAA